MYISASIYSRYNAIMRPFSPRTSRQSTILIAVTIWVVGLAVALPQFLAHTIMANPNDGSSLCVLEWLDGGSGQSNIEHWSGYGGDTT